MTQIYKTQVAPLELTKTQLAPLELTKRNLHHWNSQNTLGATGIHKTQVAPLGAHWARTGGAHWARIERPHTLSKWIAR